MHGVITHVDSNTGQVFIEFEDRVFKATYISGAEEGKQVSFDVRSDEHFSYVTNVKVL